MEPWLWRAQNEGSPFQTNRQVHRATERGTGAPLAVKVQHAGLREECASDLQAVGLAVAAAEWLYPDDFRLGWRRGTVRVAAFVVPQLAITGSSGCI